MGRSEMGEWEDGEGGCPGLGPSSWIERANSVMKAKIEYHKRPKPPNKTCYPPSPPLPH